MKNKKTKKLLTSLFFGSQLLTMPILFGINKSTTEINLVNNKLNANENYLEDATAVNDKSITNFKDYIVSYSDKNIYPVNVTFKVDEQSDQNYKAGGAQIGMTTNKQTITCTSYSGILLWNSKITENKLIKNYYNEVKKIQNIDSFKVINYLYLESQDVLFVLFGQEIVNEETTSLQNLIVFGLDVKSGSVVVPANGNLVDNQIIISVNDDSAFIFLNSTNQLIITSANTVADINKTSKIISFDANKQGFSTVKDASKNNSDSEPFYSQVNGVNENDMLVGFVPSNIPGMNYSIWISSVKTNRTYLANYALDGWTSHIDTEKTNGSYDYYVVLVNDDLKNIANTYGEKKSYIVNYKYKDFITRGYITSNASETPKFNNIYKRFYNTGFNAAKTSEYLAIYIDAFNPLCSSFAHFGYNVNLKIGHMNSAMPFNSVQADVLGPQQSDYKTFTNQNTRIDTWDVNTIGYDQTANLFYYSFSGYHKGLYVYFTSFYYMKLTNEINVNPSIVRNGYVEESRPYTITSVPFSTYQNTNQSYLVKTYINDRNSGSELLSRPTNQNVRYEKVQDGAIKFSSISNNFKNMETQISKSDFLTSRMVSAYSEQEIKNLVKEKLNLEKDYDIQIKNIDANDNTGTISFSVDIAVHNSLDTDNQNSMSVFNLSQIIISGGYKLDDLILSFKNDEAINDIKQKYNIDSIIETNNKGFVVQNFLQNISFLNKPIAITEEMITLKKVDDTTLEITLSIPIKDSVNGEGVLPYGFPKDKAVKQITYNGFIGKETPTFVDLPSESDLKANTTNLNRVEIAGIAVGLLIFATILIASIIFIKIKPIASMKIKK